MTEFIFYTFAALLILSSVMVISLKNTVHSVLFLIFAFFNAAGLFIMLGAEFIAMILIIVYVGAVAVLFLFVVMMLNINISQIKEGFLRNLPFGILIAGSIFALIFTAIYNSGTFIPSPSSDQSGIPNTQALGLILYTDYFLAFQISGIILLTAMIGAIVLTLTHSKDARRQNIRRQISRKKEDTLELIDVEIGKGVKI